MLHLSFFLVPCRRFVKIRILLLDFRKPLDRVDRRNLLTKIINAGIPDCITRYITSVL